MAEATILLLLGSLDRQSSWPWRRSSNARRRRCWAAANLGTRAAATPGQRRVEGRGDPRVATKAGCAVEGGGAVESGGGDPRAAAPQGRPAATQIEAGGGDRRKDLGGDPTPGAWIRVTEGNGRRLTDGRRGECAKNVRTVGEVAGG